MAGDGGGCGHDWADEVRAAVLALAAFEIAIAGAGAALVGRQDVSVHADAHAAAGVAPLEAGVAENFVEAFFFSLRLDAAGAGHNQRLLDVFCHVLAFDKMRGGAKIIEARIRARTDEHAVDGNVHDGHVEFRAVVAAQLLPALNGFLKRFAARDERPAFEIREGGFIRRDHAGARAAFDGHVADGHAPVHGKGANGFAAVFGDVAVAAGDARFPDDGKNQVLCRNASGAFSMHQNVERLGARLNETLRRKHMLDFAGADAKSQRAERAVGGGMTVAADKGLAGLGDAEFRADDVHDALVLAVHVEEADAGFTAIFLEGIELQFGVVVENRQRAVGGRDRMVHHRESEIGAANLAAFRAETGEGLGRGALVYEVAVNVDDGGLPGLLANDVGVPDLLIERLP